MKKGIVYLMMATFLVGLMMIPQGALAGKKKILAHSMSTVTHFWYATQRDQVKDVCKKRGVTHWFVDGQDRADKQISDLEDLAVKKPDVVLICHVSANQHAITRVQAELTAKAVNFKGNWIQIEGKPGSLINKARGDAWHEIFKKYPKLKRTGHFHGNYVRHEALRITEDVLQSHKAPIAMIYAHNDEMALGAIQAIKEAGRPLFPKDGKGILVVGVDALMPETYDAIKNGEMHNSSRWPTFGKEAATIACDYLLLGKPLPKKWLAPPYIVTRETLKDW
jgi:ABC-type sugar transport system substrate-binding protein